MNFLGGLIGGVIPMLLILAFVGGFALAGKYCERGVARFFMGILLGVGIICAVAGVAFAGCCLILVGAGLRR